MSKPLASQEIAIIGCGAIGSLFAGRLADAGAQVTAVCRSREQEEIIRTNGLLLMENGRHIRVPLRVVRELPFAPLPEMAWDLVIVLVKSFDTAAAAESLAGRLRPGTPVLTLQNGLGNAEALAAQLKGIPLLAGTTTFGALKEGPGVVRLTGRGECTIGAWDDPAGTHLEATARLFSRCGMPCTISSDVRGALWKKLAVSAVVNPLTAILKIPNGELLEHEELASVFKIVVDEVCHVAMQFGILLSPAQMLEEVRRVCRVTAANRSSMLRDIEQGRRTEIDSINGAVVRLAAKCGISVPANSLLAASIQALTPAEYRPKP